MTDPFGLRPATLADVPAMCANVAEGVGSYAAWAPGFTPPRGIAGEAALRTRWATPGFVAHVNADVSAHVAAHPAVDEQGVVHLMHLFARPHRQGTGVAAALLALGVRDARRSGATAMRLRTPSGNARGLAFYAREGWAPHPAPPTLPEPGLGLGLELVWLQRAL